MVFGSYPVGTVVPVVYQANNPEILWHEKAVSTGRLVGIGLLVALAALLLVFVVLFVEAVFSQQDDIDDRRREFERIGDNDY